MFFSTGDQFCFGNVMIRLDFPGKDQRSTLLLTCRIAFTLYRDRSEGGIYFTDILRGPYTSAVSKNVTPFS